MHTFQRVYGFHLGVGAFVPRVAVGQSDDVQLTPPVRVTISESLRHMWGIAQCILAFGVSDDSYQMGRDPT